jgi:hypothetical protein
MIACPFFGRGGFAAVLLVLGAARASSDATPDVLEGGEEAGRVHVTYES